MSIVQYVKIPLVKKAELNKWKKFFAIYGMKSAFEKETGMPRQTLYNVLDDGTGLPATVDKVREFYNSKTQAIA